MEKTLVIIKPEAVTQKLVGKIMSVYEENRLNIVHSHRCLPTREVLEKHYADHKGKDFFEELVGYMSSSDVVVLIVEGEDAVSTVRELHGATNPAKSRPGTIRYMYGVDIQSNAVHGSESVEAAAKEISIWSDLIGYNA